jgi:UDP-N-acetylmuramoyl-L-alanyl-D-glutamate--2,6-diaminopimelate ligase
MKTLADICKFLKVQSPKENLELLDLYIDSREVAINSAFIALQGEKNHGLDYIRQAIHLGVKIIFADKPSNGNLLVNVIYVENLADKLVSLANWFYDDPSKAMKIVGVTGTNGKTSVVHYASQLCNLFYKTAILGTLGNGIVGQLQTSKNTTLNTVSLNRKLAQFRDQSVEVVLMEVSSHAIALQRIAGLEFLTLALTQVTSDHLDFHKTIAEYRATKQQLFTDYKAKYWVLNIDDFLGNNLNNYISKGVGFISYSLTKKAEIHANKIEYLASGIAANINGKPLKINLFGRFNLENLMCVFGICQSLGLSIDKIINQAQNLKPVLGRMEIVSVQPTIIIDYAHTVDALESVLKSLREHFVSTTKKLWLVFGCGGDRDKEKRPLMAKIASRYADKIIITDDNPRFESAKKIMEDIVVGIDKSKNINCIHDRMQAISFAIQQANKEDLIIITGKGHEDYQDVQGIKQPMSDFKIVRGLSE